MRAETITKIHVLLKENAEKTQHEYKSLRGDLEQKYKTEWIDSLVSKEEKEKLETSRKICFEAHDLLIDFENHQW